MNTRGESPKEAKAVEEARQTYHGFEEASESPAISGIVTASGPTTSRIPAKEREGRAAEFENQRRLKTVQERLGQQRAQRYEVEERMLAIKLRRMQEEEAATARKIEQLERKMFESKMKLKRLEQERKSRRSVRDWLGAQPNEPAEPGAPKKTESPKNPATTRNTVLQLENSDVMERLITTMEKLLERADRAHISPGRASELQSTIRTSERYFGNQEVLIERLLKEAHELQSVDYTNARELNKFATAVEIITCLARKLNEQVNKRELVLIIVTKLSPLLFSFWVNSAGRSNQDELEALSQFLLEQAELAMYWTVHRLSGL